MTAYGDDDSDEYNEAESSEDDNGIDYEDRIITFLLAFGMPFLIGFIALGTIVLAYSQWKIY